MGILDGRVVIITGGANGIGRASGAVCAREGARVVLADIDQEGGELAVKTIADRGGEVIFVPTDVRDPDSVSRLVDQAVATFGRLDGAFNNAGIEGEAVATESCTPEAWRRVLEVNLTGTFFCLQAELRAMDGDGGSIVNCASVAGLVGFEDAAAYVASKHAVIGLTRSAALEMAARGIRVNAVCPGVVDTDMITRSTGGDPDATAALIAMEPIGRMGRPEEIGEAAAWLMSDRSSFITGEAIAVDGGLVAR